MLPFLSLVTLWGVSLSSFLFLGAALVYFKPCRIALATHWPQVRWVAAAFLINFLFAAFCLLARPETTTGIIEKPARMVLAISALALVSAFRPRRDALWWGVAGGAFGGALLVSFQRLALDMDRPGGLLNAITTGDVLVCFALVALAASIDLRASGKAAWMAMGAVAGLAGAMMTGTRGGLVALLPAAFLFARYGRLLGPGRMRGLVVASFALVAVTYAIPQSGARERVAQGVRDVQSWYAGGDAYTNMGIRLELWKGAAALIAEKPLLGRDFASAKRQMTQRVGEGSLDPVVLPAVHFHNDALHALVTGGTVGLLAWLAILAAPLAFFARRLRDESFAPALAGMLVVCSYFCFGLTEVIFWSVKASLLYALLVFLLMGLCLNTKEKDGK
ncbi:MAG: O-antigen ligase family protein [Pseudomonadota bacterium]